MAFTKDGVLLPRPTSVTSPWPHKVYSSMSSTGDVSGVKVSRSLRCDISDGRATKAIEGLLRSWRTLGKTRVLPQDIAKSLSLSLDQVERVVSTIRGVRIG